MANLSLYQFEQKQVRTVYIDGVVWFVLADVLAAIETTTNTYQAQQLISEGMGEGCVITFPLETVGGTQDVRVINQIAFMFLLSKSRGTKAKKLNQWFFKEVLGQTLLDAQAIINALNSFEIPEDIPEMFVYAIKEVDTGNIKLGLSRNPYNRLKQLQTGNSSKLELVAIKPAINGFSDETYLHEQSADFHLQGEWFTNKAIEVFLGE